MCYNSFKYDCIREVFTIKKWIIKKYAFLIQFQNNRIEAILRYFLFFDCRNLEFKYRIQRFKYCKQIFILSVKFGPRLSRAGCVNWFL